MIRGVRYLDQSHRNTLQNSRIGDQNSTGLTQDRVCVSLIDDTISGANVFEAFDNIFINNEIMNCNDGIQLARQPGTTQLINFKGTIIDSNNIWLDDTMFTDCSGNFDVNGLCACGENSLDIKGGSRDASNPVIISNNVMWGSRPNDSACGGSNSHGAAVVIHNGVDNLRFIDNLAYDSGTFITVATKGSVGTCLLSMCDSTIMGNIAFEIGIAGGTDNANGRAYQMGDADGMTFDSNVSVRATDSWMQVKPPATINSTISCTLVVGGGQETNQIDASVTLSQNSFYDVTGNTLDGAGDVIFATEAEAGFVDFVFTKDQYTTSSSVVTLTGAHPASPAAQTYLCDTTGVFLIVQ